MADVIRLEPSLEIRDVEATHRRLMAAAAVAESLSVDVSAVTAIDTAGAQLLLALVREAERRGMNLEFLGTSSALEHALASLGLQEVSAKCVGR